MPVSDGWMHACKHLGVSDARGRTSSKNKRTKDSNNNLTKHHCVPHSLSEILDPSESVNMSCFDAFELTHAAPHSVCWKELAFTNIPCISTTWDTSHLDKSWLKDLAPRNITFVSRTLDTSHLDRSWLNDCAASNIILMLVTRDTSHLDRSWSKDEA